jgi:hypothetical protein
MILLIVAAVCCTLSAFWGPGRGPGPWAWGSHIHIGWLGVAFYLWSIVLAGHLR